MLGSFVVTPSDLHSYPSTNARKPQASGTAPVSHRRTATSGSQHALDPVSPITRTTISLEYMSVIHKSHCPLGMYILPSVDNLLRWDGVLFIHQGYYADAVLRFQLTFPIDYPERPPAVHFITDIFHPSIGQNGLFNLSPRFKPWRPKEHHVFDILHYIKSTFKKRALDGFQAEDCLNKEAYRLLSAKYFANLLDRLYHESASSFGALATQSALLSLSPSALFDVDHPSMTGKAHDGIVFQELDARTLQEERDKLGIQPW